MNQKIKIIPLLLFSSFFATQAAEDVKVMQYLHAGPIAVHKPILADSLNVNGKPFEVKNLVKSAIPFERALSNASVVETDTAGLVTVPTPEKDMPCISIRSIWTATATQRLVGSFRSRNIRSVRHIKQSAPLPS